MDRQAHEQAALEAATRADRELGTAQASAKAKPDGTLKLFAAYMGRRFAELRSELRRELLADLAEHRGTRDRAARKAAETIARSAVVELRNEMRADIVRLSAEVEQARRELEAMKAERQQLRAIR